ncbi:MAG: hypothetical protein M3R38_02660 [Actinomycetota bacterium]|nr:hypothetical protein [Actinomycetota bacterium]
MNEYQRRAYERPVMGGAAPGAESGYYRHRETRRGVDVTVVVSVDVGEEEARRFGADAVWHVSVSWRPRPGRGSRFRSRGKSGATRTRRSAPKGRTPRAWDREARKGSWSSVSTPRTFACR